MSIPTGYEKLAVIGIAWKDEYVPGTAYKTMNGVYYKGSTYVALRDNPTGPPAADGANWQYLAKGFEQQLLSAITALDTSGVLGQAGASVGGQALMDAIADKVMTKLVERSSIVQTESTSTTTVPSSAYFKQVTDGVISDLDEHFMMSPDGVTAIQSKSGNTWRRLQVQMINDDIALFKSHDGGATWPEVKTLLTNADFRTSGVKLAEIFYDPLASSAVIKWTLSDNLIYQMVITDQGLRYDRWNGLTWENMWAK